MTSCINCGLPVQQFSHNDITECHRAQGKEISSLRAENAQLRAATARIAALSQERDREDANLVDAISKMKKYSEGFATMQQERDRLAKELEEQKRIAESSGLAAIRLEGERDQARAEAERLKKILDSAGAA